MPDKPRKGEGVNAAVTNDRSQMPHTGRKSGAAPAGQEGRERADRRHSVVNHRNDGKIRESSTTARKDASTRGVVATPRRDVGLGQRTESSRGQDTAKSFREGIEQSLEERVVSGIRASLRLMTPEQLQRAVAAPTPAATVVEVLNAAPDAGLQRETATMRALARGAAAKQAMIGAAGGLMSSGEVARLLGISVSAVNLRRARNTILALPLAGSEWGFPARQFTTGDLRRGVAEVVRAAGTMSRWVLLSILIDTIPTSGTTLLESLEQPEVLDDVLSRVGSYGEHGAS